MTELQKPGECDCTDGCEDDGHKHKWEIEPSPVRGFDVFVTDDDQVASERVADVVEQVMDNLEPGESVTITIRLNAIAASEHT